MVYPIFSSCISNCFKPSAASLPKAALLLYKEYFSRTDEGDKFGITTLAPAKIPLSLPSGDNVAKAVVAGIKAEGCINRKMEMSFKVMSILPDG